MLPKNKKTAPYTNHECFAVKSCLIALIKQTNVFGFTISDIIEEKQSFTVSQSNRNEEVTSQVSSLNVSEMIILKAHLR